MDPLTLRKDILRRNAACTMEAGGVARLSGSRLRYGSTQNSSTLSAVHHDMARLVHLDVGVDTCTNPIVTLQGFATLILVTTVLSAARMTETVPLP